MAVSTKSKITYNGVNYRVAAIDDWAGQGHLNGDHLLNETCTHYPWAGYSESSAYDRTDTYGASETLACMAASPSYEWKRGWPDVDMTRSIELWLPASAGGMCVKTLCERIEGVTS